MREQKFILTCDICKKLIKESDSKIEEISRNFQVICSEDRKVHKLGFIVDLYLSEAILEICENCEEKVLNGNVICRQDKDENDGYVYYFKEQSYRLLQEVKEARGVIEFYANKYNWDYYGNIIDDAEEKENEYVEDEEGEEDEEDTNGRRAREFLEYIWRRSRF